jgi:hypothetical protein
MLVAQPPALPGQMQKDQEFKVSNGIHSQNLSEKKK